MSLLNVALLGARLDNGWCAVCGASCYSSGSYRPLHLQKVGRHGACMLCDDCNEEFTDGDMLAAFDEVFPAAGSPDLDLDDDDDLDEYDGVDEI